MCTGRPGDVHHVLSDSEDDETWEDTLSVIVQCPNMSKRIVEDYDRERGDDVTAQNPEHVK